jgi:hypothetical protein
MNIFLVIHKRNFKKDMNTKKVAPFKNGSFLWLLAMMAFTTVHWNKMKQQAENYQESSTIYVGYLKSVLARQHKKSGIDDLQFLVNWYRPTRH